MSDTIPNVNWRNACEMSSLGSRTAAAGRLASRATRLRRAAAQTVTNSIVAGYDAGTVISEILPRRL